MDNILLELTADIVSAHASNNQIDSSKIAPFIAQVYEALKGAQAGTEQEPVEEKPQGAVTSRKSLSSPEHIISMIDGKPYKTLKRHIGLHGYTPESYRETYGLSANYPMVAPSYSARRSEMAKTIGLGRKPGQKRGRKSKAV